MLLCLNVIFQLDLYLKPTEVYSVFSYVWSPLWAFVQTQNFAVVCKCNQKKIHFSSNFYVNFIYLLIFQVVDLIIGSNPCSSYRKITNFDWFWRAPKSMNQTVYFHCGFAVVLVEWPQNRIHEGDALCPDSSRWTILLIFSGHLDLKSNSKLHMGKAVFWGIYSCLPAEPFWAWAPPLNICLCIWR